MVNGRTGDVLTPVAARDRSGAGRTVRRRVTRYTYSDKENFNAFGEHASENVERKSPLPADFPRIPLNDITAVLQPFEDREDGIFKPQKPITRSQNLGNCSRILQPKGSSSQVEGEPGTSKKSRRKPSSREVPGNGASTSLNVTLQACEEEVQQSVTVESLVQVVTQSRPDVTQNIELSVASESQDAMVSGLQVEASVSVEAVAEVGPEATKDDESSESEVRPTMSSPPELQIAAPSSSRSEAPSAGEDDSKRTAPASKTRPQRKAKALSTRSSVARFR